MWKMVLAIVVLAACIGGSRFVKLGEYTFGEHLARIMRTPEAQELGDGIVASVSSAKTKVKSKIRAKLAATKKPTEEDPDVDEEVIDDEEPEAEADEEPADEPEERAEHEGSGRRRSLF